MDRTAECTADLLGLADVQRWTVIKKMRNQSVAEHTFNVMVIAVELMERLGIRDQESFAEMFWWAMIHDVTETLTGDIDGKFKRDNPLMCVHITDAEYKAFPSFQQAMERVPRHISMVVKMADKIEAITFIRMWGVGTRSYHAEQDLLKVLWTDIVPRAIAVLDERQYITTGLVNTIAGMIDRIMIESACIQMRLK